MNDVEYMRLALVLAERGRGWTAPNPMVGAVIVKDGAVIGQGWHERYGEPHAERNALASCTADPAGATMYVTHIFRIVHIVTSKRKSPERTVQGKAENVSQRVEKVFSPR